MILFVITPLYYNIRKKWYGSKMNMRDYPTLHWDTNKSKMSVKRPQACSRAWNDPKPAVERYSTFVDKHYILASLFWCYWFIKSYSKMWGYQLIQQNTGFSNLTNTVIIVTNISLQSYKYCHHCDQHLITKLQIQTLLYYTSRGRVFHTGIYK